MRRIILALLFCPLFCVFTFSQAKDPINVDVIDGQITCGNFRSYLDHTLNESERLSNSKIYLIYYEGKHQILGEYDNSLKLKWVNPKKGDALNIAKDAKLFLTKSRGASAENIILINGGYRENFALELWVVPKDAELPKLSPTLKEKDIKFRRGKPFSSSNYTNCYSG